VENFIIGESSDLTLPIALFDALATVRCAARAPFPEAELQLGPIVRGPQALPQSEQRALVNGWSCALRRGKVELLTQSPQ